MTARREWTRTGRRYRVWCSACNTVFPEGRLTLCGQMNALLDAGWIPGPMPIALRSVLCPDCLTGPFAARRTTRHDNERSTP